MRATILVVDDDPRNRTLLRLTLAAEHDIREAADATEALAIVASERVDLVLLDVMMPGISGPEACRKLKEAAGPLFLPVLLVTALSSQESRTMGLEAGADDYLTKPVDRRELVLRTRAFLRLREQERLIREQVEHLRELASLKDDLISLIVHDLRNPVTGIRMLAEVAQGRGGATASETGAIARTAQRVCGALDDTLKVRLLEESTLPLDRRPHRVSEVFAESMVGVEAVAQTHRVGVRIAVDDDISVPVDISLVGRAIENLVANAIRHSPPGGAIELHARRVDDVAEIEVIDSGPGIPTARRAEIFDKFGALRSGATDGRRGFGLGLYMVRLVLEAHGGNVAVSEREGGGTVFRLVLPTVTPPVV